MACWGRLILVPEASLKGHPGRHESSPDTIASYKANGDFSVVGIVDSGTRLRTVRLDKRAGFKLVLWPRRRINALCGNSRWSVRG